MHSQVNIFPEQKNYGESVVPHKESIWRSQAFSYFILFTK